MKIDNNKNFKEKLYTKYYKSMRNLKTRGLVKSMLIQQQKLKSDNPIGSTFDGYSLKRINFGEA